MTITKASNEDIIRWPDGVWCYRSDLASYGYKSDDYEVINEGSPEWELLVQQAEVSYER